MLFHFEYKTFPKGNTERKKRPVMQVTLKAKENITTDAILDSDSDKTSSHELFVRDIGIIFEDAKFRKETELKTGLPFEDYVIGLNNQPIPVYIVPVQLEIANKKITVSVYWIKQNQPFQPEKDFPVILGQDSVFEIFDVHFSERQRKFFLNEEKFAPKAD